MATTTALSLITSALQALNVFAAGEPIPASDAADALTTLNAFTAQMSLELGALPVQTRTVFPLTANKGGPTNPYTLGLGGDFNSPRPPSPVAITGAGLVLGGTTPAVEVPRALLTEEAYRTIRIKDLSSALFTAVYYSPTFVGDLGTINLWPVPNTTLHALVLYVRQPLTAFTLSASYDLPPGYEEVLIYSLARRLSVPYGHPPSPEILQLAANAWAQVKRANTTMRDLATDPMFLGSNRQRGYNIVTGDR